MPINIEALKETALSILRWVVLFVVSWLITQTLTQINLVPESQEIRVWVFSYLIPVRLLFQLGLTFVGKMVDEYLHELGKEKNSDSLKKGLVRF